MNLKDNNFIFKQNINLDDSNNHTTPAKYYAVLGNHDYIDENNNPRSLEENKSTLAKNVNNKLYIKIGPYGRIFNPMGMFSEGRDNKFAAKTGKNEYSFKQVNQKVFDMYLNFLSTKNLAWLNNAEREMI